MKNGGSPPSHSPESEIGQLVFTPICLPLPNTPFQDARHLFLCFPFVILGRNLKGFCFLYLKKTGCAQNLICFQETSVVYT
jgi:hypothetical protein